jgi:hypothetical protein
MTELQRRVPHPVGVVLSVDQVSAPLAEKRKLLALLAQMQRRGEIASAWTEGDGMEGREYVVHFDRIREPRSMTPWYVAGFVSFIGGVVTLGALIYHSRYVLLWGALIAAAALVGIVGYVMSQGGGSAHQCGRSSC